MRSRGVLVLLLLVACAAREPTPHVPTKEPGSTPEPVKAVKPAEPAVAVAPTEEESPAPDPDAGAPQPEEPAGATHTVAEISLTFELPSAAWKEHPGLGKAAEGVTHIGFERGNVLDAQGHAVRPYCGITSEPAPAGMNDIVQYSLSWRMRVPFHVDEVFSHEDGTIQLKNAIGYRGKTSYDGTEHTLLVLHGLFRDRGFVVVCDATTSVFDQVRGELEAFVASLRHTADP